MNVIEEVAEGRAIVEWSTVRSAHDGTELVIHVLRDAMQFNAVPCLRWNRTALPAHDPWFTGDVLDGVRLPATALELQQIADLTGCLLLTPKVIDLIWLQAGVKFNPVVNTRAHPRQPQNKRRIVAESPIHVVHKEIEEEIRKVGGDDGVSIVSCVGKYWCLSERLSTQGLLFGESTACNYGWCSDLAYSLGVSPGVKVFQQEGCRHPHKHIDPSQVIRLMYRKATLVTDGSESIVDLRDVARDPLLAPLLSHYVGPMTYLRQKGVPEPAEDVAMPMYAPPSIGLV